MPLLLPNQWCQSTTGIYLIQHTILHRIRNKQQLTTLLYLTFQLTVAFLMTPNQLPMSGSSVSQVAGSQDCLMYVLLASTALYHLKTTLVTLQIEWTHLICLVHTHKHRLAFKILKMAKVNKKTFTRQPASPQLPHFIYLLESLVY